MQFYRTLAMLVLVAACGHCAFGQTLFVDVTEAEGVAFESVHDSSDSMRFGGGAGFADFNGDGLLDLYTVSKMGANALFAQLGDGSGFLNRASRFGVEDASSIGSGAIWGDYDNDGDPDLYVLNRGPNVMFRNDGPDPDGGWIFTDVTELLSVGNAGRSQAAAYGDYDNDGWLDLFVANHSTPLGPPEPSDTHRADALYHNIAGPNGERVFVDVAPDVLDPAINNNTVAHSVGFFDFDDDGDLDIYVVNEIRPDDDTLIGDNSMWRNVGPGGAGGWTFVERGAETGTNYQSDPMGLAIGDYNNDGMLDFAITELGANHLYRNFDGVFLDVGEEAGVAREFVPGTEDERQVGWGPIFIDYDLDGFEDLFVAAGKIGQTGQPSPLFHNNGDAPDNTFTDVTNISGATDPDASSRCVIRGDYDNDGDEDMYVANYTEISRLFRNKQIGGEFLGIKLVGTSTNRDAIGAVVRIHRQGMPSQTRLVQSGSTTSGSHDLALTFGVTGYGQVDTVEITWLNGTPTELHDVAVNQKLTVVQPGLLITGQATVIDGGASDWRAILYEADGSSRDVTGESQWDVDLESLSLVAEGESLGHYAASDVDGDQVCLIEVTYGEHHAVRPVVVKDAALIVSNEDPADDTDLPIPGDDPIDEGIDEGIDGSTQTDAGDEQPDAGDVDMDEPDAGAGTEGGIIDVGGPTPGGSGGSSGGTSDGDDGQSITENGDPRVDQTESIDDGDAPDASADASMLGASGGGSGGGGGGSACGSAGIIGLCMTPFALLSLSRGRSARRRPRAVR